jgi:hypothetical protein
MFLILKVLGGVSNQIETVRDLGHQYVETPEIVYGRVEFEMACCGTASFPRLVAQGSSDNEGKAIADWTKRVCLPVAFRTGFLQGFQPEARSSLPGDNLLAATTTAHHVVDGIFVLDPQLAGHPLAFLLEFERHYESYGQSVR